MGYLLMAASTRGIAFLQFADEPESLQAALQTAFPGAEIPARAAPSDHPVRSWVGRVQACLAGRGTCQWPDLPLDLQGTPLQKSVWTCLQQIPQGETRSYRELAHAAGSPQAVRAVASACAANRIAVLVPCHRILRSDGGLGGYRWGLGRKQALLAMESGQVPEPA